MDEHDVWTRLAAALPQGSISWRQDGKPSQRDGRWYARFVAYVDANTVRERLDGVVPGEWDLTLDLLPLLPSDEETARVSFKARLQILGVIREDVGTGRDYKSAATDAFKRAGVRFGIANELYDYEQNWVPVDGDSRFAKPLEDPQTAYNRRWSGRANVPGVHAPSVSAPVAQVLEAVPSAASAATMDEPAVFPPTTSEENVSCPSCGGRMWDNRVGKRNPKAPDFKCRDRSCDGVIWPPKGARTAPQPVTAGAGAGSDESMGSSSAPLAQGSDDIPF